MLKLLLKRNLKYYWKEYFIIFGILFSVSVFCCAVVSSIAKVSVDLQLARDRLGADVAITGARYEGDLEQILYYGVVSTLYLDRAWEDRIREVEQVQAIASQMYLGTLPGAGCCDSEVQLIAFNPADDFQISPYLNESCRELKPNEIILGSNFLIKPGDTVKYYNKEFTVVAIMEETGLSLDSAAYISYEALDSLIADPQNTTLHDCIGMTSVIYIRSDGTSGEILSNIISSRFGRQDISVVKIGARLDTLAQTLEAIEHESAILLIGASGAAIIVCMFTFASLLLSRRSEIGAMLLAKWKTRNIRVLYVLEICSVMTAAAITAAVCVSIFFGTLVSFVYGLILLLTSTVIAVSVVVADICHIVKCNAICDLVKEGH